MPNDIESDESVMRRLKAGQPLGGGHSAGPSALDELVRRWSGPLKCFIQRMCEPASAADDIHQEVWTRVFMYRKSFDDTRNFRAYLFSIAANACRSDHRRQSGLRLAAPSRGGVSGENLLDSAPSDDPPVIDSVIAREQSALLHQGIARLPECQRAVVLLYVLYDKDYARIAQAVNRTVETVRGNMHQALKNLRRILHGMQQDVEGQVDCERQTH